MKRLVLIILLFTLNKNSFAQMNTPLYDLNQKIHFGFSVIGTYGKMKFSRNEQFFNIDNDTITNISSTNFPGLGVGGIMNFHLSEFWDLRTMAIVQVMAQRDLTYHYTSGVKKTAHLQSTYFELPILFKYKTVRHKNFRAYVIGGLGYRYNFTNDAETERSLTKPIVGLRPSTFHYDLGFGVDLYYPYFKFSPEVKISNDLMNALIKDQYGFTKTLGGLYPKLIQFSLHFE
jgi:hypothetical protein